MMRLVNLEHLLKQLFSNPITTTVSDVVIYAGMQV